MRSGHPGRVFRFGVSGELRGLFDGARLEQVFANLLNNAVQHGAEDSPVILEAEGGREAISVRVKNYGPAIPADALQVMFNPLVQFPAQAPGAQEPRSTNLGLGLFIARHIVLGHGGTLEVESSDEDGTIFTARLPRTEAGQGVFASAPTRCSQMATLQVPVAGELAPLERRTGDFT